MEERLERLEEAWNTFIVEFPFCLPTSLNGKADHQKILFLCSAAEQNPAELCFALFGPKILLRQCQAPDDGASVPLTRLIFVYAAEMPPALKQTLAHYQTRLNTPVLVAQKSNVHKTAQHVIEYLSRVPLNEEREGATDAQAPGLTPMPADAQLWVGQLPPISLQAGGQQKAVAKTQIQDYRAEYACRYVLAHYKQDINRDRMAANVHLSPGYFSNLFRSETGMSFSDYLIQVRIENAKRLLRRFDISVDGVSRECGFHSLAHFSRTFKERCGVAPLKYRKSPAPPPVIP